MDGSGGTQLEGESISSKAIAHEWSRDPSTLVKFENLDPSSSSHASNSDTSSNFSQADSRYSPDNPMHFQKFGSCNRAESLVSPFTHGMPWNTTEMIETPSDYASNSFHHEYLANRSSSRPSSFILHDREISADMEMNLDLGELNTPLNWEERIQGMKLNRISFCEPEPFKDASRSMGNVDGGFRKQKIDHLDGDGLVQSIPILKSDAFSSSGSGLRFTGDAPPFVMEVTHAHENPDLRHTYVSSVDRDLFDFLRLHKELKNPTIPVVNRNAIQSHGSTSFPSDSFHSSTISSEGMERAYRSESKPDASFRSSSQAQSPNELAISSSLNPCHGLACGSRRDESSVQIEEIPQNSRTNVVSAFNHQLTPGCLTTPISFSFRKGISGRIAILRQIVSPTLLQGDIATVLSVVWQYIDRLQKELKEKIFLDRNNVISLKSVKNYKSSIHASSLHPALVDSGSTKLLVFPSSLVRFALGEPESPLAR